MKLINTYINEKLVLNKDNVKEYSYNAGPFAADCEKNKKLSEDELENVLLWEPNDIFYWYHDDILEFSKVIEVDKGNGRINFSYLEKEKNNIGFYPIDRIKFGGSIYDFYITAQNRNKYVCSVGTRLAKLWDGDPI